MYFTQTHERLPLELVRRIQRGTLSVSLLARQTGFGQPHLSNFLHNRRQLSLEAINRVLAPQHMTSSDLLPVLRQPESLPIGGDGEQSSVPLVSHHAALTMRLSSSRTSERPRRSPCCNCRLGHCNRFVAGWRARVAPGSALRRCEFPPRMHCPRKRWCSPMPPHCSIATTHR